MEGGMSAEDFKALDWPSPAAEAMASCGAFNPDPARICFGISSELMASIPQAMRKNWPARSRASFGAFREAWNCPAGGGDIRENKPKFIDFA
jgi:hypothetical protein